MDEGWAPLLSDQLTKHRDNIMTHDDSDQRRERETGEAQSQIAIDPKDFFDYASAMERRWQELIGLDISHCKWGAGTIKKVEGGYIYVDLPQRLDKKNLTEFGQAAFRLGFFHDLLVSTTQEGKIRSVLKALKELQATPPAVKGEPEKKPSPGKKPRAKATKATKKAVD